MTDERKAIELEIIHWLGGIAEHTDNDVERNLLMALVASMEDGEHRDSGSHPEGEDPKGLRA